MPLPAMSSRKSAATSICPWWPRTRLMRASNGVSLPRAASTDSAPATQAAANTFSAWNRAPSASAVETCVPLRSARPSFGCSASGSSPARRSASTRIVLAARVARAADAEQHGGQMRERREIAGGADRALRRDAGIDLVVDEPAERLRPAPA